MRRWDRLIIVCFLAVITAPGLGLLLGVDGAGRAENRALAAPPAWPANWAAARSWPDAFTRFFEDHFALRDRLVRMQARFRLETLNVSPSPAVLAGDDGWFYYADDSALEDYTVEWALTPQDLETWRDALQDTQDWLAARGIAYAFVVAPDKHVVYPEFFPDGIRRLREQSWTDQLVAHLRHASTVNVVDLRPVLTQAKARERIYHKTDTHWNERGAHAAYVAILESLGGAGLRPEPRHAFVDERRLVPGMDLAGMLGLTEELWEEDLQLRPVRPRRARMTEPEAAAAHGMYPRMTMEVADRTLPRAVIFRDSFMSGLVPFVSEHFSRTVYLWEYDVNPDVIATERPDVVIQQIVGRHLGHTLPYNYFEAGQARNRVTDTAAAGREGSAGVAATHNPVRAPRD